MISTDKLNKILEQAQMEYECIPSIIVEKDLSKIEQDPENKNQFWIPAKVMVDYVDPRRI